MYKKDDNVLSTFDDFNKKHFLKLERFHREIKLVKLITLTGINCRVNQASENVIVENPYANNKECTEIQYFEKKINDG
jgi:hypothetical protein